MLLQKLWLIKWGFGGEGEEQLWRQNPLSITNPSAKARIHPLPLPEREKEPSEEGAELS